MPAPKTITEKKPITHRASTKLKSSHAHIRRHYYNYMPNKKHHRVLIWVIFLFLSSVVAVQLLYPLDRAVPLAKIGNQNIAYQTEVDLSGKLTKMFQSTELELRLDGGKTATYKLAEAGAEQDVYRLTQKLTDYPFWQRLVPFSLLWQQPKVAEADVYYTENVLTKFSQLRAKELSTVPKNARLAIEDGKLVATDDKPGYRVSAKEISQAISEASFRLGVTNTVNLTSHKLEATTTSSDFAEVKTQAQAALAREMLITADEQLLGPTNKTVASWLVIGEANGEPALKVDKKIVAKYIESINKKVGTIAGNTNITIVDGQETSRTIGKKGRAINSKKLTADIEAYLLNSSEYQSTPIVAEFVDVEPVIMYNSRYTATERGLQAYISDESKNNTHIEIQQLSGEKWHVAARATESIPSASTYKLYVAMWLFDRMKQGKVSWNDPWLDTTVSNCFDRMTIASTNECARAWLADYGRENMNSYVYSRGFSGGTSFTRTDATHTTARDLTKMMVGIYNGSLMNGSNRARLLHSLSIHPYRYGVPTGSAGRVEDKVGFLWDYVHDAAIVHHPKGTYVIVVMTKGRSYAAIAEITRQVERIMYP